MPELLWFVSTCVLAAVLVRLSWTDIQTQRLPDRLTFPLIVAGLAFAAVGGWPTLITSIMGGAVGFASLALLGQYHFSRTGREGLGLGDAKLFAAAGTWMGWAALPVTMLIAATSALVFVLITRRSATQIPFGPWLSLGFFAVWLAQCIGWVS